MRAYLSSLIVGSLLVTSNAWSLTNGASALVKFETKANAVSTRDDKAFKMPHFEIPLSMVGVDFADRFPQEIRKHLIFEKNGEKYVRWVLNPEDTKWFLEVQKHFAAKGLTLEKKYYFTGYQTASRSYIVEDPNKEIQFSVKSSTDKTGGYWADKKQPVGEADDSRLNADFLAEIEKKQSFEHIIIMDEPAIMKIDAIDQAVVVRDLHDLNNAKSGKIYVPGFSVLHDKTGRDIAAKNGSNDPKAFWTEHYIKAVGRALGELAARTGMQFDSPHSQNFLVELDSNYKPTGRIVLRDLADLYIYEDMIKVLHPEAKEYLAKFSQRGNIIRSIAAGFGPLHGNTAPSWVSDAAYERWGNDFFRSFEGEFQKVSGLKIEAFKRGEGHMNGRYFGNSYNVSKDPALTQDFWSNLKSTQTPRGIVNCSYVMFLK